MICTHIHTYYSSPFAYLKGKDSTLYTEYLRYSLEDQGPFARCTEYLDYISTCNTLAKSQ